MASDKINKGNLSDIDFDLVHQRQDMERESELKVHLAKLYTGNFQEKSIEELNQREDDNRIRAMAGTDGLDAATAYYANEDKTRKEDLELRTDRARYLKHRKDEQRQEYLRDSGLPDVRDTYNTDRSALNNSISGENEATWYARKEAGANASDAFMSDIGDDADAWLAANGGSAPTSESTDIYGNNDVSLGDLSDSDADLLTDGNASKESRLFDGIGSENETGGASSMHIQLERFTNMSLPQVKYAYDLLSDPTLTGQHSTRREFNGDVQGVTAKSAIAAAEAFNVTVHGRGEEFRHELGLFIDRADRGASEAGRTMPSRGAKDQMMMQNMLGVTAETKEAAGPGSSLYGANLNPESQVRADDDIAWLAGKLNEYSVMYNRDDTRRNSPELYTKRLDATKNALGKWLEDSHPGQKMIDPATGLFARADDPSKLLQDREYIYESTAVPLPNELGIRGLRMTANKRDNSGSPYTRLEYAAIYPTQDELMKDGIYQPSAFDDHEARHYSEEDRLRLSPSIKRTFFNKKDLGKEGVDAAYDVMRKDFKKMAKIMKRETASTQDENWGNGSRSMAMGQSEEEYARQEAINMSKIFDLDQTNEEISVAAANESGFGDKTVANLGTITGKGMTHKSGRTPEEQILFDAFETQLMLVESENARRVQNGLAPLPKPINPSDETSRDADFKRRAMLDEMSSPDGALARRITGEDKQGMYGAEGSSQSDHFVALMTGGMSADDAYEEVVHGLNKGSYRSKLVDEEVAALEAQGPAPVTDQELYLARQKLRLESGEIYEQRTEGWYNQREGVVTGSGVKSLLTPKGQDALVAKMVGEATGTAKKFVPNFYTSEGTKYEASVQKMFEERTGLKAEEAYFETNEEYAGFGASPDGIVFDNKGNARGVAEFKMHNSVKAMKRSYNDYYNQVQMQMAITDTKEAHFFRINSETDDYMYDVIERDQDHIEKLIKAGAKVLKDVDYITNNTEEADMGRNLSIDEVNDLIQDSKEDFEGYVPTQEETRKAKKHKAYGSKAQVIVPVKPKDPKGSLSAHVRAFEMESRRIDTASFDSEAFDKQKFDTKMAKEVTRMQKEDKTMLAKEEANEKKLHDKKMKNEEKFNDLRNKNLGTAVSMFSNLTKQLVSFNRGAGEDAMGIANSAAALGMDANRAAGQRDLISEAGNMSAADANKLVFAGAQQQNAATAGGGQLRGFMDRQKAAAVTAARGGYSYQVYGPVEMGEMNPGSYLGSVMSKIDGMDKQTQAKILGELGLGAASSLIGRTTGDAIHYARHAEYVEDELRDKDRIIRQAAGTARDIGFSSLRNTSDAGIKISEAIAHVLDNPMGMAQGIVGKLSEVGSDAASAGKVLGLSPIETLNRTSVTNSTFGFASRSGSPFGNLGSATPDDSIQEAMTFRTSDEVAPKGKTTVNSNLKVEITENDINTSLTDNFGNTSVSTQPRNGGM